MPLVLKALRGDEALDLRCLGVRFLALLFRLDFATDDELADLWEWHIRLDPYESAKRWDAHIIFLAEAKEASNLGRSLRTQSLRVNGIRQAGDVRVTLLHDAESKDGQVHPDDASTNTLPLSLAGAARAVTGVTFGEQQTHSSGLHHTLLHRKALLVVAPGDLEDVAFELVANAVGRHLLAHPTVHEHTKLSVIVDVDELLCAVGRV